MLARRTALLLGAGDDADDAVQEAFAKAFRHLDTFRDGAAFKPWLLRIVANETRNLHRSAVRRTRREDFVQNGVALLERSPEDEVVASITREGLLAAVDGLPEHDRAVIVCRYFLEMSEAETAEVLGLPRGTVKSRHSRALAKLRRAAAALAIVLAAVGIAAAVSPQVRAAIAHVLRFAGIEVEVRHGSAPPPAPGPVSPGSVTWTLPGEQPVSLETARSAAKFQITIPARLGTPDYVTVSDGARVVSLFFHHGTVRLDEFDGSLPDTFGKIVYTSEPEYVQVGAETGYWFAGPQDIQYIGRDGKRVVGTAHRTDGTLIWQSGGVALRLEGIADRSEALAAVSP